VYVYRDGGWVKNPNVIYPAEGFWIKKSSEAVSKKRYTIDSENNTCIDNKENLMWQNYGLSHSERDEAIEFCKNLSFAGYDDWRLPTKAESKVFHYEMNNQGDNPYQLFDHCTAEIVTDGYVRTKKGAEAYGGEPGDVIGFRGGANVRCVRDM